VHNIGEQVVYINLIQGTYLGMCSRALSIGARGITAFDALHIAIGKCTLLLFETGSTVVVNELPTMVVCAGYIRQVATTCVIRAEGGSLMRREEEVHFGSLQRRGRQQSSALISAL
jgi:hypothetical protein